MYSKIIQLIMEKLLTNSSKIMWGKDRLTIKNLLASRKGKSLSYGVLYLLMTILFTVIGTSISAQCTDPTPEILGDFSVCGGETVTYTVETFDPANTYLYSLAGGGTIDDQSNGEVTITFDTDAGGPFLLTLTETVDTCSGTASAAIIIEGDAILVCNDNLNISLASDCTLEITPDIILESPQFPEDSYEVTVKDEFGNPIPNILNASHLGMELEISVTHLCSGNVCWGDIILEDKLAPEIMCENDTLTCDEFAAFSMTEPTILEDNCGDATLEFEVVDTEQPCSSPYSLIRAITWIATDASGNESDPCTQLIHVERVTLADLSFPPSYDGLGSNPNPLSCSGNFATTDEGYPALSVTGQPGGDAGCSSIEFTFSDTELPICDATCTYSNSNYKVIRTFVAVDWCTGEIREETQIIKVLDTQKPTMQAVSDITMSVNPFDCSAQVPLPIPTYSDNCTAYESLVVTYTAEMGTIINNVLFLDAPAKTMAGDGVEVTVTVADCCGNTNERTFEIFLTDDTPPVVVADSYETISLLPTGQATLYATSLDDGSYDNCGPVEIKVKRMDNGSGNPSIDLFPPSGNDNAQFNEVVHFFCSDVDEDNPVMVQLQVCDDAGMDGTFGNTNDNCNTAMVEVTVQNKYAPVIQCPANTTISCIDFESIDINDQAQMNALFGTATSVGPCNPTITSTANASNMLNCGTGFITRNFTATSTGGTDNCTQTISVVALNENLLTCDRISFDELNNSIYNWCTVNDGVNDDDDDLPAINIVGCQGINIAEVNVNTADLCTTVGVQTEIDTFDYAGSSACKKYVVHYEVIDQCVFDENYVNPATGQIDPFNSNNGYFEMYLEYNVVDNDAPVLTCESVSLEGDNCDGSTASVSIVAEDECTPENELLYEFRVDVGANGSVDFPAGNNWFTGNSFSGSTLGLPAIPPGNHILLWRVDDGCGNSQTCSQNISVSPFDKAPTPYCLGGLSTAVMNNNGSVEIWAEDFDNGSQDDCGSPLTFTMIRESDAANLNNPQNQAQSALEFDCDDIPNGVSAVIELRIYVTDETGAFDYCTVTLKVEDNEANICPDNISLGMLSGDIVTTNGTGLKDAMVQINSIQAEYPKTVFTDENGAYSFDVFLLNDYSIYASDNTDYLYGITTADILLIQKHILGLQALSTPYKMIAADVNNDCKIAGNDIIQVRKLLLGYYENDELPANESWRFIQEGQDFGSAQPCDFSEQIDLEYIQESSTNHNFVAVKVADVNGTTENGLDSGGADVRSGNSLDLIIDNQSFKAGDIIRIPVNAANFEDLKGLQFTMSMNKFVINGLESGGLNVSNNNVNMNLAEYGLMSISYDNIHGMSVTTEEALFTVIATAVEDGELRENVILTDDGLVAESYFGIDIETGSIELNLRDGNSIVKVDNNFTLLQNQPNPFSELTNIRFELPSTGEASLKIYDITGRLVYAKADVFNKGYNMITIRKEDLSASGELFYQLEYDGNIETRRMILIK